MSIATNSVWKSGRRLLVAVALVALVSSSAPRAAWAEKSTAEAGGWGVASGLCSLVYAPVKIVYAVGGGLIGGLAWVFSAGDNDVANAVITPAVRGDYVVTTGHLRGEEPLEFIGRDPAYSGDASSDVASDGGW
jgi:hypothetical protein